MIDHGVGSWPARRARITPDAVALRQGDRTLTYAELAGRVDALAAALAARGVTTGDRVAYLGANDMATFETFFAVGRLGAIFVPLNTRLTATELSQLFADCAPTVLAHGPEVADVVPVAFPGGRTLPISDLPFPAAFPPATAVGLDDPALLLYTSGTTGRAKGAVLTHGNLTWNTMNQLAHVDILSTDVVLCTAPLFHVTGLGQVSLPALFKGGTVVVAPRFDPGWMLGVIPQLRINGFSAVPTMLQMLCDHPQWVDADLSSLRYVIYGGSTIQERVATQLAVARGAGAAGIRHDRGRARRVHGHVGRGRAATTLSRCHTLLHRRGAAGHGRHAPTHSRKRGAAGQWTQCLRRVLEPPGGYRSILCGRPVVSQR